MKYLILLAIVAPLAGCAANYKTTVYDENLEQVCMVESNVPAHITISGCEIDQKPAVKQPGLIEQLLEPSLMIPVAAAAVAAAQ